MMKVLFANNYYYLRGGSERVYFDEIDLLENHGHEVIPFSRLHPENSPTPYDSNFPMVVEYDRLSLSGKIAASPNIVYSWTTRRRFAALLDETRPDLLHGHNIYGGLTTSILDEAKRRGLPAVLTLHDLKLICPTYLMLREGQICELCNGGAFWHCTAKRCHKRSLAASLVYTVESYFNRVLGKYDWVSRFICPSRFLVEKHVENGFPRERFVYLPNSLDPAAFVPEYESRRYVLYVGRLSREKGIIALLDAFRDLDIPLRIVGTGPLEEEVVSFCGRPGMENVNLDGYRTGKELEDLYRAAAFVVMPSEWYENAPMTILEALFYGKPVVGSRIGGIPEMVEHGETGMLIEPGNVRELRERIREAWGNPKNTRRMGKNARELAEKRFSHHKHYESLMNIYEKVCE